MSTPAVAFLAELESARKRFQLKPVHADHEGLSLAQLPEGVYGYTVSSPTLDSPLFAARISQSFECHKLPGGTVQIVGFAKPAEVAALNAAKEAVDFKLYPEPFGESSVLCVVDMSRIVSGKAPSRTDGNFMTLQTNPRVA